MTKKSLFLCKAAAVAAFFAGNAVAGEKPVSQTSLKVVLPPVARAQARVLAISSDPTASVNLSRNTVTALLSCPEIAGTFFMNVATRDAPTKKDVIDISEGKKRLYPEYAEIYDLAAEALMKIPDDDLGDAARNLMLQYSDASIKMYFAGIPADFSKDIAAVAEDEPLLLLTKGLLTAFHEDDETPSIDKLVRLTREGREGLFLSGNSRLAYQTEAIYSQVYTLFKKDGLSGTRMLETLIDKTLTFSRFRPFPPQEQAAPAFPKSQKTPKIVINRGRSVF